MTEYLFVYGTLAPDRSNAHQLESVFGSWRPASVRGHHYPESWGAAAGYPGVVLDADGPVVPGFLFSSGYLADHWERLDEFEGDGYRRVRVSVEVAGDASVEAWVYELVPPDQASGK